MSSSSLYLRMTDKLSAHFKANSNAYPRKYVLSPTLRDEYMRCLSLISTTPAGAPMPGSHMGAPIEIDDGSPGVMVAADGTEVPLL